MFTDFDAISINRIEQTVPIISYLMKNSILFLLALLVLSSSGPSSPYNQRPGFYSFALVGPYTRSAFQCLKSYVYGSFAKTITRGYQNSHSPAGIDPNAQQTLLNAHKQGIYENVYVEICRNMDATSQINSVVTTLNNVGGFIYTTRIYIKVQPSPTNPDCSWQEFSHSDNCRYLYGVIDAISQASKAEQSPATGGLTLLKTGIFTTANIWNKYFGSTCNNFASDTNAYLWYANYKSDGQVEPTQSFADFVPFGGWTLPTGPYPPKIKQVGGNVTYTNMCGNANYHSYVDQIWSPRQDDV